MQQSEEIREVDGSAVPETEVVRTLAPSLRHSKQIQLPSACEPVSAIHLEFFSDAAKLFAEK